MFRELIQEYLVGLGVQIDKPGFNQMNQTLQSTEQMVAKVTGSWGAQFAKAAGIIGAAIAGVTATGAGLIKSAARQEIEMEKLSRSMLMTKGDVLTLKRATDALGESLNDILLSPELTRQFRQLTVEGRQMQIGGDFKETMGFVREVLFEFTRLKQEAQYALTWIGYYLAKYLAEPLAKIKANLKEFNDAFIGNMGAWAEKIAKWLSVIINVGLHFVQFLTDVGKALWAVWDSFPKGVKIAIAAITALGAVCLASPFTQMIMVISALLLLIDDYYAHMEGRESVFGEYWDKLNEYLETASEWTDTLGGKLEELIGWFEELYRKASNDKDLKSLGKTLEKLGDDVGNLGREMNKFTSGAFAKFMEGFGETDTIFSFGDVLRELWNLLEAIGKTLDLDIKKLKEFFQEMRKNKNANAFWQDMGKAAKGFLDILTKALIATGKIGQAFLAWHRGDWREAKRLVEDAYGVVSKKAENRGDKDHAGYGRAGQSSRAYNGDSSELALRSWEAAQRIGAKYNVDPALIYGQWYHETGGFTSELALEDNNFGGLTQAEPLEGMEQPDGSLWYMRFSSPEEYFDYYTRIWGDTIAGATDADDYVQRLWDEGYFTGDPNKTPSENRADYAAGMRNGGYNLPSSANVEEGSQLKLVSYTPPSPDPYILNGMANGFMNRADGYQAAGLSAPSSSVYNLSLGGITVNGNVNDPKGLSQMVGNEVMTRLNSQARSLLVSRSTKPQFA